LIHGQPRLPVETTDQLHEISVRPPDSRVATRARPRGQLLTRDGLFLVAIALLVLQLGIRSPIGDPDLGWHLKGGEYVWRHAWPPTTDEFSYTIHGQPWIAYSWLAELVFWLLADRVGFHALILFCAALVAAAFVVVYLTCRGAGASPHAAFVATVLGAIATAPAMTQRPGLASFLFGALFWRATVRWRERVPVRLWVLVPLTVLWANVHVFFVFGLAWLWAAVLWELAERFTRRQFTPRPGLPALVLTALLCSAAVLVNPYGIRLVTHVLEMGTQPSALPTIIEYMSPDFHGPDVLLIPLLLALIGVLAWTVARPDAFHLVLVLTHTAAALYMRRNVPFLAIVAAPMLALAATRAFAPGRVQPSPGLIRAQTLLVLAIAALTIRAIPTHAEFERNVRTDYFPVEAVRFLKAQPSLGRMLNTFNWGGFLIYTLYPRYQVSIDGRGGAYGEQFLREYLSAQSGGKGWQAYVDRLAPDFVLCERDGSLAALLAENPRWTQVYADKVAAIFVRSDHPDRARLDHRRQERDSTPNDPAASAPLGGAAAHGGRPSGPLARARSV